MAAASTNHITRHSTTPHDDDDGAATTRSSHHTESTTEEYDGEHHGARGPRSTDTVPIHRIEQLRQPAAAAVQSITPKLTRSHQAGTSQTLMWARSTRAARILTSLDHQPGH